MGSSIGRAMDNVERVNPIARYGFDPASFAFQYSRRRGMNRTEASMNAFSGGLLYSAAQGSQDRREAQAEADRIRETEEERQARTDGNILRLREQYGVGDTWAAEHNRGMIDDWLGKYETDSLRENNAALDEAHKGNEIESRRQLSRQGLLGGAVDLQAQRKALNDYVTGRQRAVAGAKESRRQVEMGMTSHRQNLEQQIMAGTQANPDWTEINNDQSRQLESARQNIVPQAMGDAFTIAGNAYRQDQAARGAGNRGFTMGGGGGASSGTISRS